MGTILPTSREAGGFLLSGFALLGKVAEDLKLRLYELQFPARVPAPPYRRERPVDPA